MDNGADRPQEPEEATPVAAARTSFDAAEVGARLREARLALGYDVVDVASELRIRRIYLQAIEEGRLSDLPGSAYVTGFLRVYGDYLGLDGREIIESYKAAGRPSTGETDLSLPSPVEEGRLPTRPILLLAALLAVGAYGVWYYMAKSDRDPVESVAALPDQLIALIEEPTAAAPPETAEADRAAPEPPANDTATAPTSQPVEDVRPPALEDPPGQAEGTVTDPVDADAAAVPGTPTRMETAAVQPETAAAPPPIPVEAAPEPVETETAGRSATVAPEADGGLSPLGGGAAEQAETLIAGRIVLQANTDIWLEVGADGAAPVYSGVLRRGGSYPVPAQSGLTLMTGDAGGIDILVDGRAIPKLGPRGAVKRDVVLDADRLLGLASQ